MTYTRPGLAFPTRHYWLAFSLFICALLSKSVTATLPAALLVVVWWQRGRLEWRRDVLPLVPWLAIAAAAGAFTAWFEHQVIGAKGEAFDLTIIERAILAGRVIWFYLGTLVWPARLIFIYPRWTIDATSAWQYLYPAGAVALAVALASVAKRGPLAGYLFFCGTLVPALGFVNVYPFVFSYVADHFQYLASLGIIVPAAAACDHRGQPAAAIRQASAERGGYGRRGRPRRAHLAAQRGLSECGTALSRYDRAQSPGVDGLSEPRHRTGGAESAS